MARMHNKPPQGADKIESRKWEAGRPRRASALVDAAYAEQDPDAIALQAAFGDRDLAAIGRLTGALRARYSKGALRKILWWAQHPPRGDQ